jgi:hypothetical protein
MSITVVMASLDLDFGFRNFAPESFPEFDHPWELDYLWFCLGCDVEFVAFCVLVRVVVPTNRTVLKRTG